MNPNSALIWYPATKDIMSTPKTIMVPYNHGQCACFVQDGSGNQQDWLNLQAAALKAADEIGYPVFIRTDLASGKHSGPRCYRADSPDALPHVLANTIIDNEMKFWMEPRGPQAIMVREFLELRYSFTAFHGFRVSREWRFFANGTHCLCKHPYWPESLSCNWVAGIIERSDLDDNIQPALKRIFRDDPPIAHSYAAPSCPDWTQFNRSPGIAEVSNFVLQCYKQLGLPMFQAEKWEQNATCIGCLRATYSAIEQRLAFAAIGGNFGGIPTKSGVEQANSLRLDLFELNHRRKASTFTSVDSKTAVTIEDASKVRENYWVDGWCVVHSVLYTPTGDNNPLFLAWFQPDGKCLNNPSSPMWKQSLSEDHEALLIPTRLEQAAISAAAACGGDRWSVDFAMDRDGEWYLIDMARMENSWHWPGCPNGAGGKQSRRDDICPALPTVKEPA